MNCKNMLRTSSVGSVLLHGCTLAVESIVVDALELGLMAAVGRGLAGRLGKAANGLDGPGEGARGAETDAREHCNVWW